MGILKWGRQWAGARGRWYLSKNSFPWSLHAVSHQCLKPAGFLELVTVSQMFPAINIWFKYHCGRICYRYIFVCKLEVKCLPINPPVWYLFVPRKTKDLVCYTLYSNTERWQGLTCVSSFHTKYVRRFPRKLLAGYYIYLWSGW